MRRRATVSAALAAALLLATTGCTFVAEIATLEEYDPSDGVGTTVGDVQVRNMLAVTEDGERASLIFAATNHSDETVRLNVSLTEGGEGQQVRLPGRAFASLGSGAEPLVLEGLDVTPGSLLPVYVQYGDEPGRLLQVPVMDGALPEYAAFVPTDPPAPEPAPAAPAEPVPGQTADPNAPTDPNAPAEPAPGEDEGADQPPTDG